MAIKREVKTTSQGWCGVDTIWNQDTIYRSHDILINPCNAYNINQDSGAWVLILEGFWVLKLVFEWCRIHIKTVLAQHYSLVVFTYAWFIQATPVQVGPGPPKSAQVNPNLQVLPGSPRFSQVLPGSPRFSQVLPGSPRFSQVLPGSPRFSQEISDFLWFCGFPGFLGRTWVLFSAFLWVSGISWENLGVIFCVFCGFPGFPGRTWVLFSALLWGFRDFLGEPGWKQLGMGLGELQELVRGKVAGGWPAILTRNFQISAAGVAAPFGLQVCHALKFSYKHYRGIANDITNIIYIYI